MSQLSARDKKMLMAGVVCAHVAVAEEAIRLAVEMIEAGETEFASPLMTNLTHIRDELAALTPNLERMVAA